ncbi:MAG: hypothetical protein DCC67_12270 [Planctomycetota bacterium]|nr:MAG: hypothetical protein DCC67_12270 [Planctomycetota bacterium]
MNPLRAVGCAVAWLALAPLSALAATVPYFESFEGYPEGDTAVANFTEVSTGRWVLAPSYSGQAYENAASVTSAGVGFSVTTNSSAGIEFPALASSSFSMSTTFRIDSLTLSGADPNNTATIGLFARSATVNPAATGSDRYQVSYFLDEDGLGHPVGRLWLREINLFFSDSLNELSSASLPVTLGDVYKLTFSGVDSGSSVALAATLTNLTTMSSISVSDVDGANVLSHGFFGYQNHVHVEDGGTVAMNADFDDFTMVIPEPGAAWFGLVGMAVCLRLGRRR